MLKTSNRARFVRVLALAFVLLFLFAACGGDDDTTTSSNEESDANPEAGEAATNAVGSDGEGQAEAGVDEAAAPEPTVTPEPTATPEPAMLRILVTNDDGFESEGIDLVAQALSQLTGVEVTVVAPLENQSGSSDTVSGTALTASDVSTASGFPALAVDGTPADSVNYALAQVFEEPPDLIVSGSNDGQNVGPLAQISGTVGAARTGARQGVPAFAISQAGLTVEPDFGAGIPLLVDWVEANRDALLVADETPAEVWSLNVASCGAGGSLRGLVEVPLATEFVDEEPFGINCLSTLENPDDDATALSNGFAALTQIPEELVLGNPSD